jgi:hypothetical protein
MVEPNPRFAFVVRRCCVLDSRFGLTAIVVVLLPKQKQFIVIQIYSYSLRITEPLGLSFTTCMHSVVVPKSILISDPTFTSAMTRSYLLRNPPTTDGSTTVSLCSSPVMMMPEMYTVLASNGATEF